MHELLATPTPPELGPGPRPGVEALRPLQSRIDAMLEHGQVPATTAPVVRALILLWHDHHDAAHELVQDGATADASYVHGIVHRREPDFSNARYWFHRVGRHGAFNALAREVPPLLQAHPALREQLLPGGQWDALAFIDACEAAESKKAAGNREVLRDIQRVEFEVLLKHLGGVSG